MLDEKTLHHMHSLIARASLLRADIAEDARMIADYPEDIETEQRATSIVDNAGFLAEALEQLYDIVEQEIRLMQRTPGAAE